ncbi:MAG TPA: rRNA maturation RNase YbeY [Polyangiaceae bacterium]|nr:rRNA maturation RNase YbeY [Polyangiaceae bacterium]HMR75090.1 rRNA maturation RNase YbeY [Polyangiaceae bacterium]
MPTVVRRRAPGAPKLSARAVRELGDVLLGAVDQAHAELSVLLTDDRTIHALNLEHRGKDKPTDVLAFPLDEDDVPPGMPRLLGDVVISLDTAARQARGRRRELLPEVRLLLAHGLLHLLGFDHDTPAKKKRMTRETRRLVRAAESQSDARPAGPPRTRRARISRKA